MQEEEQKHNPLFTVLNKSFNKEIMKDLFPKSNQKLINYVVWNYYS